MTASDRFWPAFRAYVGYVGRAMPGRLGAVLAITVAQAFTEGIALLLLVPLLGAVGLDVGRGTVASLADYVRGAFGGLGLTPTLGAVVSAYVVMASVHALIAQWQMTAVLGLEHRFVAALRQRLYAAITRANWLYLSSTRASELAHVLTQELERVGTATYQVLTLFSNAIVASVYLAMAFRLSPAMTLIVCLSGSVVLLALRRKVTSARTEGEMVSRARSRLFATAVEHVSALRTAKSYGAEQQHIDSFAAAADDVADAHVRAIGMHAGSRAQFDIGAVVALALMLYVGLVALRLSPAGVLLLLYVFARTMPRLSALQQAAENVAHFLGAFESVAKLESKLESEAEARAPASATCVFRDHVRLEGVSFAHDKGLDGAVQDVSLEIGFGMVTAIVGPSGSGKSTLADLLIGLHRPQRGRVLVDDVALDESMVLAWKRQVGYVDQDTFLFPDTVAANLQWANPDATTQDTDEALALAAADFVFALPDGLDTVLGDRGVRLSGGERQRLALARALIRKPRLLLLDEATSALDAENEQRILDAIDRLRGRVTVVLITHRLSAVRRADAIHVLEAGRVVESGDWRTLSSRPAGRFRALWEAREADAPRRRLAVIADAAS